MFCSEPLFNISNKSVIKVRPIKYKQYPTFSLNIPDLDMKWN